MPLFARLLALFLIIPVVELFLLIRLEGLIDFWPTIGLIVFTGFLGSYFAKREGLAVWRKFNGRMSAGALPGKEVVDGIIILCSGALLIAPGVITDLLGILGLLPPTRALIRRYIMKRAERAVYRQTVGVRFGTFSAQRPRTSDAPPSQWGGTPRDVPGHAAGSESQAE